MRGNVERLLEGRVGLVTGAGAGIGQAIAMRFAANGASVVIAELTAAPNVASVKTSLTIRTAKQLPGVPLE